MDQIGFDNLGDTFTVTHSHVASISDDPLKNLDEIQSIELRPSEINPTQKPLLPNYGSKPNNPASVKDANIQRPDLTKSSSIAKQTKETPISQLVQQKKALNLHSKKIMPYLAPRT